MAIMRRHRFAILGLCLLMACGQQAEKVDQSQSAPNLYPLAMNSFPNARSGKTVRRSNTDIAAEFLDLSFALESGAEIPVLTRFAGPITIAFARTVPRHVSRDLDLLLQRLRNEAHIEISRITAPEKANIVIETLPLNQIQRLAPSAACFVVPEATNVKALRKGRFNGLTDWRRLQRRQRAAVFLPINVSPQESRDCLHEEIAQALGPLNDLYRLADSVFNDDNFNVVLTGYDMLILRIYYAPELKNGMTRDEVARILPNLLHRLNPAGRNILSRHQLATSRHWSRQIERSIGPNATFSRRQKAAADAIKIARDQGYTDQRLGFSYLIAARLSLSSDPKQSAAYFARAFDAFSREFGTDDIHTAHASLQMASLAFSGGDLDQALRFLESALPAAKRAQDALLLFSLLAIKAEILDVKKQTLQAKALRQQAIAWGRYGYDDEKQIHNLLKEISGLRPKLLSKRSPS